MPETADRAKVAGRCLSGVIRGWNDTDRLGAMSSAPFSRRAEVIPLCGESTAGALRERSEGRALRRVMLR
jgi:hypothetical protein